MNGMFAIQNDGSLVELQEHPYETEDVFQQLLADYPDLIPGDQLNPDAPRKWLLVTREAGIPSDELLTNRWSVDHLFLDQDAIPTLIEIKRSSDTRIRREVVGQVLEYAANATLFWPLESIRAKFEAHCEASALEPQTVLSNFLDGSDSEAFWKKAFDNLEQGKIRLLFVADVISSELKRIVEFMNFQMSPAEVLAVEIRQFVGADMKTLVPRVIGMTAMAEKRKKASPTSRIWTEEEVLTTIDNNHPEIADKLQAIVQLARDSNLTSRTGSGAKIGSIYYVVGDNGKNILGINTCGSVEFMLSAIPEEQRRLLLQQLSILDGLKIDPTDMKRTYLSVPHSTLASDTSYQIVRQSIDELLRSLINTQQG